MALPKALYGDAFDFSGPLMVLEILSLLLQGQAERATGFA